jgi:uncharacterized membrane protein
MESVYNIVDNNCYDVCISLLNFFEKYSEAQIVLKKKKIQVRKSLSATTAIQGAAGGAFFGPLGLIFGGIAGKTYGWICGKLFIEK